jgi:ketosteroid isomerase-like protein
MSEENVEIVRAVFEAWNRRDFEAGLRFLAPEIELHLIGGFVDLIGGPFKGRDGVLRFWREIAETLGGQIDVDDAVDLGDQVVATITFSGTGAESGVPAKMQNGYVCTFRDGMVSRVDAYYNPADALEAAGLSE